MKEIKVHGLKPTPADDRDFKLGALTTLPALASLPESLKFQTLGVKDQQDTDMCSAFATDLISELQEGIELCPEWGFAVSKSISGDVDNFGQDLRTAFKRHVKYGALRKDLSPFSLANKDPDFLRRLKNWPPGLLGTAFLQSKASFVEITGPYDHFDNVRATLAKFEKEKRGAVMGITWQWSLLDVKLSGFSGEGFGHAIAIIGYTPEGLILQNSAGSAAGDNGCHILPREEANHFIAQYKAYMMIDRTADDIKYMMEHGIKLEDGALKGIFKAIINVFLPFLSKLWKK